MDFFNTLTRLGDTYALIILGSVLAFWVVVIASSDREDRAKNLTVGLSIFALAWVGLLVFTELSLIWKTTLASVAGFFGWYLGVLILPSLAMWSETREEYEERRWRERQREDDDVPERRSSPHERPGNGASDSW